MSESLTPAEKERYDFFNRVSKERTLSPDEGHEYNKLGVKYAGQLERENREFLAKRAEEQAEFFEDKRKHGAKPGFERDFKAWLELKDRPWQREKDDQTLAAEAAEARKAEQAAKRGDGE